MKWIVCLAEKYSRKEFLYYEANEIEFPKIHKLRTLLAMLPTPIDIKNPSTINILDELYIDSRYPGDFGLLPDGKPTLKDAQEFYDFALVVFDEVCAITKIDPDEVKK